MLNPEVVYNLNKYTKLFTSSVRKVTHCYLVSFDRFSISVDFWSFSKMNAPPTFESFLLYEGEQKLVLFLY